MCVYVYVRVLRCVLRLVHWITIPHPPPQTKTPHNPNPKTGPSSGPTPLTSRYTHQTSQPPNKTNPAPSSQTSSLNPPKPTHKQQQVPALALLLLCGELRVRGLKRHPSLLLTPTPSLTAAASAANRIPSIPSPSPTAAAAAPPTVLSVSALESGAVGAGVGGVKPISLAELEGEEGSDGGDEEEGEEEVRKACFLGGGDVCV